MKTIYYGHAMVEYNTEMEKIALKAIREKWEGYKVINPKKIEEKGGTWVDFLGAVREADILVFRRIVGYLTNGVVVEILEAIKHDIPIYELKIGEGWRELSAYDPESEFAFKIEFKPLQSSTGEIFDGRILCKAEIGNLYGEIDHLKRHRRDKKWSRA